MELKLFVYEKDLIDVRESTCIIENQFDNKVT